MLADILEFIQLIVDFIVTGITNLFSFFEALITGLPQIAVVLNTLPPPIYSYIFASMGVSLVGIIIALL